MSTDTHIIFYSQCRVETRRVRSFWTPRGELLHELAPLLYATARRPFTLN